MPKSTTLSLFPDLNVWIALTYGKHVHHRPAKGWLATLPNDVPLCFCRFTQLGFLRLLTTEAVMENEVLSQKAAWTIYDSWVQEGRALYVDEPASLEPFFRSLSQSAHPTPKDWADSYLAAFAAASGMRLVTFDKAFHGKVKELLILRA